MVEKEIWATKLFNKNTATLYLRLGLILLFPSIICGFSRFSFFICSSNKSFSATPKPHLEIIKNK